MLNIINSTCQVEAGKVTGISELHNIYIVFHKAGSKGRIWSAEVFNIQNNAQTKKVVCCPPIVKKPVV
jgi:hypothetical protein